MSNSGIRREAGSALSRQSLSSRLGRAASRPEPAGDNASPREHSRALWPGHGVGTEVKVSPSGCPEKITKISFPGGGGGWSEPGTQLSGAKTGASRMASQGRRPRAAVADCRRGWSPAGRHCPRFLGPTPPSVHSSFCFRQSRTPDQHHRPLSGWELVGCGALSPYPSVILCGHGPRAVQLHHY